MMLCEVSVTLYRVLLKVKLKLYYQCNLFSAFIGWGGSDAVCVWGKDSYVSEEHTSSIFG